MAMPPTAVAEFLKQRAGKSSYEDIYDPVDVGVEEALRGRGDLLINLALARYGRHMEAVSALFQAAEPGSPVRLACLANRALADKTFFCLSFPVGLLIREPKRMAWQSPSWQDNEMFAKWLVVASDDELDALFENPTLSDSFLRGILKGRDGWESIPDDKLCHFVSILHCNPRMWTPREEDWDGNADFDYSAVFDAAWRLAETAPATKDWADALGWLYEKLQPDSFSIKEPLALVSRWHVDPDDVEAKDHATGYLGAKGRVRKGLARLALHKDGKLLAELLASDDIALRAAAYAAGSLNADQLRAGYEKDGNLAYNEAIQNPNLWMTPVRRKALYDIARSVDRADKYYGMDAEEALGSMTKYMQKKHPEWFADEEA
ncbi:hypothetical protein [Metallibacterium scheffleri]